MELEVSDSTAELSWFHRTTVAVLRFVPGASKTGASKRVLQAARGSAWTMVGYAGSQVLRLATQLLLARILLGPQAFGLVALVSVFLSGLEMLSDLGVGVDVIQHPRGDDPAFINTAFLMQAGRGVVLWAIAAALAYPFANFYHQPAVRWMIFVAAISVGLRGFASGSIWTMTRHVQIGKLTALNVSSDFAGFVVAVVWAFISPTAWALVVGKVTSSAVYMIGSHLMAKYPVSLDWDSTAAKDILLFGTGVFVSSATYFMSGEAERLIIGKFITVAELGCFALALSMATACSQPFSQLVTQVFYPMIAVSIRENREMAIRHFKKSRTLFLWASVAVGFICVGYGQRIVALLLPPKFAMAGWMLQWLGFRAAQQVYVFPSSNLVLAFGDSKYPAISNTARFIMMAGGLWIAFTRYGLHEAVMVLALSSVAAYLVLFPSLVRHLGRAVWFEISRLMLFLGIMGARCNHALALALDLKL